MKVLTQGSFDVFHEGHKNFLSRLYKYGRVYVGVLTDESYNDYRGYMPDDTLYTRMANVKPFCDHVFKTTPKQMAKDIETYKPDILAIGTDWVEKDIHKQWGVGHEIDDKLIYIPYTPDVSSTEIKAGEI